MADAKAILLVEDDELVRRSVAVTLEAAGHTVTQTGDAGSARRHMDGAPVDLVIADVWMPGGTGIDLLKAVRSGNNPVPFIFISGGNAAEPLQLTIGRAEAHGAVDFLMKPFDDHELLSAVERVTAAL